MRFCLFLTAVAGVGLGLQNSPAATNDLSVKLERDLVAQVHFVGTAQIAVDTNAAKLTGLGALPETIALREQTLGKLASAPYRFLRGRIGAGSTNDYANLLRPLVEDLLRSESYVEVRGPDHPAGELLLAVRLSDQRAQAWSTNLAIVLADWTKIPVTRIQAEGFEGWELVKHKDPDHIRFFRAGDWVLFGWGQGDLRLLPGMLQRIKTARRPVEVAKGCWLDARVDWPAITAAHPVDVPFKLPKMRLVLEGRADFLRPQLTMQFAEPLNLKLEPWRIPTNTIHNPINSFTAVRGVVSRLNELPAVKNLHAQPLPDQVFTWAMEGSPFETCLAAAVTNATNYLEQIQPGLIALINSNASSAPLGIEASWTTNHEIEVRGLLILQPYLRAVREAAGDFLLAGAFPSARWQQPMPPELVSFLTDHPKLVYYDWEITAQRLAQWRGLMSIMLIATHRMPPDANLPAQKWLNAVQKTLGNCATDMTLDAPNQLTLVRNSFFGLTSVELVWLAAWLDSPDFPLSLSFQQAQQITLPGAAPGK